MNVNVRAKPSTTVIEASEMVFFANLEDALLHIWATSTANVSSSGKVSEFLQQYDLIVIPLVFCSLK